MACRNWVKKHPQAILCLLIFAACSFVYLANNQTISSSDNFPNTLLAFNWLFNHTLNFDAFREGYAYRLSRDTPYFFVEAPNGHLTSTYPIGSAIATFPLYCLFALYLKLTQLVQMTGSIDITSPDFREYRSLFEKLAAAIATSLSAVIFYLSLRLKLSTAAALSATFVFAFATNTWMTSSQGLWQHGIANLLLLSTLLCLLKANRISDSRQLLLSAGFFCGLLPGVRPTSLFFVGAIALYVVWAHRRKAGFFGLGLSSLLLSASWNFYYFGFHFKNFLVGGYSRFSEADFVASYYQLSPQQFQAGFWGSLISPSRGLLIFTPIALFAIPGAWHFFRQRWKQDEMLIFSLAIAALAVFLQYCFFTLWMGGWCYGPRYMTDLLPVLCWFIGYFIQAQLNGLRANRVQLSLFLLCLTLSVSTQIIGAFGWTNWDGIPFPSRDRVWNWQDSQIERSARHLATKIVQPLRQPQPYLDNFAGTIEQIQTLQGQPLPATLTVQPAAEMLLRARLTNTGRSPWFGYQTGMAEGLAIVAVRFVDRSGREVPIFPSSTLYVSGSPQAGERAEAIGLVTFPAQPGDYRIRFSLAVQGLDDADESGLERAVTVAPRPD